MDVVAFPLGDPDSGVGVHSFDLGLADFDMVIRVAMPVSIIGFPFGISAGGGWPIWETGHIATEPDVDYDGRPAFLIDATTRGGMSGSPVVARVYGVYQGSDGIPVALAEPATRFLGVYSGRIHAEAEIGRVWRPSIVQAVLHRATTQGT